MGCYSKLTLGTYKICRWQYCS